jgi:hypothetical protein
MFTIEEQIPWEELQHQVRQTTLLNQPTALPYAESDIKLSGFPSPHFDDDTTGYTGKFCPILATTRYVLSGNRAFQDRLRQDLNQQSHGDQLSLIGGLVLRNTETNERSVLVPPIIEWTHEEGHYVLDGAHRIQNDRLRRQTNTETSTVTDHFKITRFEDGDWVRGSKTITRPAARLIMAIVVYNPAYPSYARPNSWREIKEVDAVPENPMDRKDYRTDYPGGYKALYRDLSHLGSSGLRNK